MLFSCEKEKEESNTNEIIFEGISITDVYGGLSSQDTTDWNLNDIWMDKENSLFTEKKDNKCSSDEYSIISYPNPCDGIFLLRLTKPDDSRFAFRVVDKDFNVLVTQDSIMSNSIAISLEGFNVSNEIVRIYYKYFGMDCELKGHGDIKIE